MILIQYYLHVRTNARVIHACVAVLDLGLLACRAEAANLIDWRWNSLGQSCDRECSVMVFGGTFVETAMTDIFLKGNAYPGAWDMGGGGLLGIAASRTAATLFGGVIRLEPEIGAAKRFGNMDEWEFWGAVYARYTAFPWNNYIRATAAISTGLNYASDVSDIERRRAGRGSGGSQLLHYLSPEVTFAPPNNQDFELVVRFHHRSGAYGLVSDADGGAHYLTGGLRVRF